MADLSSETKTEVIQETTTNEANAIVTRANEAKIDEDMVGDQLRGLVDPSGIPLHGCVGYQEGALLAAATGAAEGLPGAVAPVCSGQVHHDHDPWPGRTKKNKKQARKRRDLIQ